MKRVLVFVYGVACYLLFFAVFAYSIGFLGNLFVPKSIDSEPTAPLGYAIAVNFALLALFALQHSVMARPAFKARWTRIVPVEAERSTYVLFTCLALGMLFWLWEPIGGVIWSVESGWGVAVLYAFYAVGWATVFIATCLINHFDLFGLRQVWLCFQGKEYTSLRFTTPGPYRLVRHPLYVGWLIVMWATPTMTMAHLLFAVTTTAYILIAIQLEERDLVAYHGADYERYRQEVPMLIPRIGRTNASTLGGQSADTAA